MIEYCMFCKHRVRRTDVSGLCTLLSKSLGIINIACQYFEKMDYVKECHNLRYDKVRNEYYCVSSHVCYKDCCFRNMFEEVKYSSGHIVHIEF